MSSMLCVQYLCTYICDIYRACAVVLLLFLLPVQRSHMRCSWRTEPIRTDSEYRNPRQSHSRSSQQPYQRTRHSIVPVCGRDGGVRERAWRPSTVCPSSTRPCHALLQNRYGAHSGGIRVSRAPKKRTTPETSQRLVGGSPHPSQGSPAHEIQAAKRLAACCCRKCYCRAQR